MEQNSKFFFVFYCMLQWEKVSFTWSCPFHSGRALRHVCCNPIIDYGIPVTVPKVCHKASFVFLALLILVGSFHYAFISLVSLACYGGAPPTNKQKSLWSCYLIKPGRDLSSSVGKLSLLCRNFFFIVIPIHILLCSNCCNQLEV